ncbi:MAG: hypothetical protein V1867_01535 [Candidatus Falkowbacteria bacterium]
MSLKLFGWPKGTEEKNLPSGKKEIILTQATNMKEFERSSKSGNGKNSSKIGDKNYSDWDDSSPKIEPMRSRSYDDTSEESHSPSTRQERLKRERREEGRIKAI